MLKHFIDRFVELLIVLVRLGPNHFAAYLARLVVVRTPLKYVDGEVPYPVWHGRGRRRTHPGTSGVAKSRCIALCYMTQCSSPSLGCNLRTRVGSLPVREARAGSVSDHRHTGAHSNPIAHGRWHP